MPAPPNLPTNHADGVGEVITAALINDLATAVNDVATNGAVPKGAAGGVLQGTYPNPSLITGAATGTALGPDVITTGTAQTKTGVLTAPFRDKGGQVVNVKAYGAFADGLAHLISASDISANSQWIGTYTAGVDSWDYVASQEAIYAAFAVNSTPGSIVWNGISGIALNKSLYFPQGLYYITKALFLKYLSGGVIYGDGRLTSRLMRVGPTGTATLWQTNGCGHSTYSRLGFLSSGGNHGTNGSLLDIDWDGTSGGAALHGTSFYDCNFDALSNASTIDYAVRVAFSAHQGDTFSFTNCLFQGAKKASVYFGGFNALSQGFSTCDFIGEALDSILVAGGCVNVWNCQFEGTAWGTGAKAGYCVNASTGAGNHSNSMIGCRLEVPRMAYWGSSNGPGMVTMYGNTVAVGASRNDWVANTAYALNDTVRANGCIYLCTVAGTSQNPGPPAWAVGGATIVDNTVTWVHQDFDVVTASAPLVLMSNLLPWGQVKLASINSQTVKGNTFTRADWLNNASDVFTSAGGALAEVSGNRISTTGIAGGTSLAYSSPGHATNTDIISDDNPTWMGTSPIIWQAGSGTNAGYGDVGLGRTDGTTLPNNVGAYNETRYSRNRLELLGDGSLGRPNPTVADTAGTDLRLQGGLGLGTGVGGGVSLRAAPAGSTGTTPNNASEVLRVDPTGIYFKDVAIFNGQSLGFRVLTELTTIAAAATTSTTIQIPAGAVVHAVSIRVTTTIPTASSMMIGDGTTAAKFNTGASIAVSSGTTDVGTKAGPTYYAAATNIVITPNLTPGNANGRVRVTIHYYQVAPPTS